MPDELQPEETAPEQPQDDETTPPDVGVAENDISAAEGDSEVFPREYVEKLRKENASYRQKAKDAESFSEGFAKRLHTALVAATGKLADPTDLAFDPEHLMDETALADAIDRLIAEKPHLRARTVAGDVGQGNRGQTAEFSLLDILKSRA